MKITITGGSGFIGSKLSELFLSLGHEVLVLDIVPPNKNLERIDFIKVNLLKESVPQGALECDAIVHLAGVNIFSRWTENYKKLILESRTKTASALIRAVKNSHHKPKVFVSASAVGYYGEGGEKELDESSGSGNDFLAFVCKQWEETAKAAEDAGMRWVSLRTGIVIGKGGGVLSKLIPVFKMFLGGPIGSGKQWFSWVHLDDIINIYKTAVFDERLTGPINAVSPYPVYNRDFAKAVGKALHRPALIPAPKFALKIVLGELANAVLVSQRVIPKKLSEINFTYSYPKIKEALEESI